MHTKKYLGFSALKRQLSKRLWETNDLRQEGKVEHSLHDCFMSAFAMMFFQDPSVLQFQRRMQEAHNINNLKTMFGIEKLPGDTQLREVLDQAQPDKLEQVFLDYFRVLQRGKHLENFEFMDGKYLIPIDGSGYFSSDKICCPGCLTKISKSGKVRFHHQILQAVVVHPDIRQVIPLAPEPIQNTDGKGKQDCEINASKRIIKKIRKDHPKLGIIVVGDGLYSKQPFVDALKAERMSFFLVVKPKDHKILFEWFSEQRQLDQGGDLELTDLKGRHHCYEWVNDIPLNNTKDADNVNFFQYRLINKGKVTYKNSWVTDMPVNENNVAKLTRGARARWKIENEGFNTLKNQGYHLEHNFGHGKQNLSMTFFRLNLLAFFMHQIFELTDPRYQKCRAKFSARKAFWGQLRFTIRILIFRNWEHLLDVIICPPDIEPP